MSIFKNNNEASYVGGRKHWTDVLKNSGPADALIWRQPEEDFNDNSTLIVMPGEEAVFVNGGVFEKRFTEGTYKLNTSNYPFISRLKNMFSGGVSTYNCVVFFVRKAQSTEVLWGTSSPIQVRDKLLDIATKVRARGSYKFKISDAGLFISKFMGNTTNYISQQELLDKFFANEFQGIIKSQITQVLNEANTELLGIAARMTEISAYIYPKIKIIFNNYGLELINFNISAMDVDDDELRHRYDEIGIDAIEEMRKARAQKAAMDILGPDWGKQQAATILNAIAQNEGAGGAAAIGAGMGMGVGAGATIGSLTQELLSPMNNSNNMGNVFNNNMSSSRFQQQNLNGNSNEYRESNNAPAEKAKEDPFESLATLKKMLDAGLIEKDEYDTKKIEILNRM